MDPSWGMLQPVKMTQKLNLGVSENSVPLNPMVLLIIIPIKWLFVWEYTQHFQTNPSEFSTQLRRDAEEYRGQLLQPHDTLQHLGYDGKDDTLPVITARPNGPNGQARHRSGFPRAKVNPPTG